MTQASYDEIYDFLLSSPTLEQLANYKVSDGLDHRIQWLLDKNSQGTLTERERAELEQFHNLNHIMKVLKAKARLKLDQSKSNENHE